MQDEIDRRKQKLKDRLMFDLDACEAIDKAEFSEDASPWTLTLERIRYGLMYENGGKLPDIVVARNAASGIPVREAVRLVSEALTGEGDPGKSIGEESKPESCDITDIPVVKQDDSEPTKLKP